jgi:hypothetical protein
MIFTHPNFGIRNGDITDVEISPNLQVNCLKHKEQLFLLGQLQNPKGLKVINSGINSNLNVP